MTADWFDGEALSLDTETTGTDVLNDRIVTAAAVRVGPTGVTSSKEMLINPGVEIPEAATRVHGITTAMAVEDGEEAPVAVFVLADHLRRAWTAGLPVIAMNAPFDLSLLQAELKRYALEPLDIGPVLDPLVIDRHVDPYRKGKRNLTALAAHYNVKQGAAHSAVGDALTAARIVWALSKLVSLRDYTLDDMQQLQREAHEKWAAGFQDYMRKQGKDDVIDGRWPSRSAA